MYFQMQVSLLLYMSMLHYKIIITYKMHFYYSASFCLCWTKPIQGLIADGYHIGVVSRKTKQRVGSQFKFGYLGIETKSSARRFLRRPGSSRDRRAQVLREQLSVVKPPADLQTYFYPIWRWRFWEHRLRLKGHATVRFLSEWAGEQPAERWTLNSESRC